MKKEFVVGDSVTWVSQAGGYTKRKTGVVVAVVGVRESLHRVRKRCPKVTGWGNLGVVGQVRDHVSYVVQVERRGLYWPIVNGLKRVAEEAQVVTSICDACTRSMLLEEAQTCETCGGTFCDEHIGDLEHECEGGEE